MEKFSTLFVGQDARKDSIDVAKADPGRDGEVRQVGSAGPQHGGNFVERANLLNRPLRTCMMGGVEAGGSKLLATRWRVRSQAAGIASPA